MKRPRILFYIPVLGYGGVERVVQYLSVGLSPDYDIVIAGQGSEGENLLAQAKLPANIRVLPAPSERSAMKHRAIPMQTQRLRQIIEEHQPDAIMTAWPRVHITAGLVLRGISAAKRPKWVLTEHNEIQNYLGSGPRAALKTWALRQTCLGADAYVAVSQKIAQLSGQVYQGASFKVIYNPALSPEIDRKAAEPLEHPWFQGQTPLVLSVGRLDEMKDYPTLIRAFKIVQEQMPQARLAILGEGILRPGLEALVSELGLGEKIWMPGIDRNPYKYMARATVFTMSSAFGEASPLVLSEAMYLGKTVVLTRFATAPEFVDSGVDGLITANVRDPQELAKVLLEALRNPQLRAQFAQRAPLKVKDRFLVERAVANYKQLFDEVLGASARQTVGNL